MLLAGILYKPYFLVCMGIAVAAVWLLGDTWEWTQRLTWPKAVITAVLLWVSLVILATQEYNPFIYFIF